MVFNFRLVSDEVEHFKREIQIDADDTFYDLHNAICEAVGFSKNEMASFFLCDDGWEKEKEITLEDMGMDDNEDAYLMDECRLSDFIDDEGQKLMFTFDYLNDRSFFMEMKSMQTGRKLHEPVCTLSQGTPPLQELPMETFEAPSKKKASTTTIDDFDDTLDDEVGYNPDEYDPDGFSEIME